MSQVTTNLLGHTASWVDPATGRLIIGEIVVVAESFIAVRETGGGVLRYVGFHTEVEISIDPMVAP